MCFLAWDIKSYFSSFGNSYPACQQRVFKRFWDARALCIVNSEMVIDCLHRGKVIWIWSFLQNLTEVELCLYINAIHGELPTCIINHFQPIKTFVWPTTFKGSAPLLMTITFVLNFLWTLFDPDSVVQERNVSVDSSSISSKDSEKWNFYKGVRSLCCGSVVDLFSRWPFVCVIWACTVHMMSAKV